MSLQMISQTTDYALRAMVCLAERGGTPMTSQEIADLTGVPDRYLAKVLGDLSRAGFVTGQRGTRGGFMLARLPQQVSVMDVVNAVASTGRVGAQAHRIPDTRSFTRLRCCLDEAATMIERVFVDQSIAGLVNSSLMCDSENGKVSRPKAGHGGSGESRGDSGS